MNACAYDTNLAPIRLLSRSSTCLYSYILTCLHTYTYTHTEIGNTLLFLRMMDAVTTQRANFNFQQSAFFLGIKPTPPPEKSQSIVIPTPPQGPSPLVTIIKKTAELLTPYFANQHLFTTGMRSSSAVSFFFFLRFFTGMLLGMGRISFNFST